MERSCYRHNISLSRTLKMCLCTFVLLLSVLHTGISSVRADVRCYCNLPACVTSGYMCKSSLGVCVSDHFGYISDRSDVWRSRHACLEHVQEKRQGAVQPECSSFEEVISKALSHYPVRICCREDMCNYAKNELHVLKLNHSQATGYLSKEEYLFRHGPDVSGKQQLWFRAAVIAVPIAGGFILILLIMAATKMLREDSKCQRRPAQYSNCPLPPEKLETCIRFEDESPQQYRFVLSKSISASSINFPVSTNCGVHQNQLYRNVSISASTDSAATDTSREKYFVFDV